MASKVPFFKPVMMLWLLAVLGLASTAFSVWGVWRVTDLSTSYQARDDRALVIAVDLKEQMASFSKLTYDFLLQNDFNRMMLKEKQSDSIRAAITQNVSQLVSLASQENSSTIESIRYNILQFLVLTDKALETAVEEGTAVKARGILQDEVEPALKSAQDAISTLIGSRQKFGSQHAQFIREQSLVVMFLLIGLAALALAVVLSVRMHLLQGGAKTQQALKLPDVKPAAKAADPVAETPKAEAPKVDEKKALEAPSLVTLAQLSRIDKLHRDMDDLKLILQGMERGVQAQDKPALRSPEADLNVLATQGDKIAMAIGRAANTKEQSKHFVDTLSELMSGMQTLATEGNMIALNVTIELAKLQAQAGGGKAQDDKSIRISDQIRGLATAAAGITGKLAMILSQYRYAHEDFQRQVVELQTLKNEGSSALDHVKQALTSAQQASQHLWDEKASFSGHVPLLAQKLVEMETQLQQIKEIAQEEIETRTSAAPRAFKVIPGGAA